MVMRHFHRADEWSCHVCFAGLVQQSSTAAATAKIFCVFSFLEIVFIRYAFDLFESPSATLPCRVSHESTAQYCHRYFRGVGCYNRISNNR